MGMEKFEAALDAAMNEGDFQLAHFIAVEMNYVSNNTEKKPGYFVELELVKIDDDEYFQTYDNIQSVLYFDGFVNFSYKYV